ncbi:MAG: hypothetical protein SPL08_04085 [Pseudomonadota bacterium]|nr:hypothetical protein [Pseudomonadota bacterium]
MLNLWTPAVIKVYDALGGQVRLVGGCVRDYLMDKKPNDIDMATPLPPDEVRQRLSEHSIKSHPISPRHGLTEIIMDGERFEITTLRKDSYVGGRQKITFIADYATDGMRRDFTMNALSMDREQIYDYFGGRRDIQAKVVRFIGEPSMRISEDPLRIFRYIRFWANFGRDEPDTDIIALFPKYRDGLAGVSLSRRKKEFAKIIMGKRAILAIDIMRKSGLLPFIVARDGVDDFKKLLSLNSTCSIEERLHCFNNYIQQ